MQTDKQFIINRIIIDNNGCWLWQKSLNNDGYGICHRRGQFYRVHRLTYTLFVGPIPNNYMVLHNCDIKACCNPKHLKIGTHVDNMYDLVRRCGYVFTPKGKFRTLQIAADAHNVVVSTMFNRTISKAYKDYYRQK